MTLIELLIVTLFCAGPGFLGHLVSPRWGCLAGVIPFGALLVLIEPRHE